MDVNDRDVFSVAVANSGKDRNSPCLCLAIVFLAAAYCFEDACKSILAAACKGRRLVWSLLVAFGSPWMLFPKAHLTGIYPAAKQKEPHTWNPQGCAFIPASKRARGSADVTADGFCLAIAPEISDDEAAGVGSTIASEVARVVPMMCARLPPTRVLI